MTEVATETNVDLADGETQVQQSETGGEGETLDPLVKAGDADAPEHAAETDEQINERVAKEAREKSERRQASTQARINELTADKYAERRRADELAAQLEQARTVKPGATKTVADAGTDPEPQADQFTDFTEFHRAVAKWEGRQEARTLIAASLKAQSESTARTTAEAQAKQARSVYIERAQALAKEIPDYAETMREADVELPQNVINKMMKIPEGPLVAYHMVKNPELAKQFRNADPELHDVILGRIAASLKAPAKASNAPAPGIPARPRSGSGSEPPSDPDRYAEWADKNMK